MTPLRVLIADDEAPARRRLRRLLPSDTVEVVGETGDGVEAVALTESLHPDLLILDIRMPERSGLDVVASLGQPRPHVIFVTAYDAHAVRAFELNAVDYVLKPVTASRLAHAIARVRHRVALGSEAVVEAGSTRSPFARRLAVTSVGRVDLVDVDSIDWIEAASNYVVLHCGSRQHTTRGPLGRVCALLDPCQFVRVHRSFVVRLSRIQRFEPILRGDWTAVLADGTHVLVSRTHRKRVFEAACLLRATP